MWFVIFFTGFGGRRRPRASEQILIVLEGESEAFLCPTAFLEAFGFELLGGWSSRVPPVAGKIVLVLSMGGDGLMRVLISLGLSIF